VNALDLFRQQWIIGATAMPPPCSVAQEAPCILDGGAALHAHDYANV